MKAAIKESHYNSSWCALWSPAALIPYPHQGIKHTMLYLYLAPQRTSSAHKNPARSSSNSPGLLLLSFAIILKELKLKWNYRNISEEGFDFWREFFFLVGFFEIMIFRGWETSCNPEFHALAVGRHHVDVVQQQKSGGLRKWSLAKALFNVDAEGSPRENIYQKLPSTEEICCREKCKYYSAGQGQRK